MHFILYHICNMASASAEYHTIGMGEASQQNQEGGRFTMLSTTISKRGATPVVLILRHRTQHKISKSESIQYDYCSTRARLPCPMCTLPPSRGMEKTGHQPGTMGNSICINFTTLSDAAGSLATAAIFCGVSGF